MTSQTKLASSVISLSDQIRALALEGLKYAKDPYDIARYEKLLEIATQKFSEGLDLDFDTLKEDFKKEIGCVTPKLGADAAVLNEKGELLVLNRSDNTGWCLPCGWVDVGETPATAVVREVKEETGLDVESQGYISVSAKGPGLSQNIQHQVNIIVATKLTSNDDVNLNHEHTNHKWISSVEGLKWHPGHDKQARKILAFVSSGEKLLLPVE